MAAPCTNDLRQRAIDFTGFWNPADTPLHFTNAECIAAAESAFAELSRGKSQTKKCIRISGQSGSGKSTQIFPAASAFFDAAGIAPVHVAVRNFVKFHPRLDEILRMYGDEKMRENTNAFALLTLLLALEKFIAGGYSMIFEVTLLSPDFEKYISTLLADAGYSTEYHILAVPKSVSDIFVSRRAIAAGAEHGRMVLTKSADFFYDILPAGIDAAAGIIPNASAIVWSAFDIDPVFVGIIGDSNVQKILAKYRANADRRNVSEDKLRFAKISWFINRTAI